MRQKLVIMSRKVKVMSLMWTFYLIISTLSHNFLSHDFLFVFHNFDFPSHNN